MQVWAGLVPSGAPGRTHSLLPPAEKAPVVLLGWPSLHAHFVTLGQNLSGCQPFGSLFSEDARIILNDLPLGRSAEEQP